MSSQLILLNKPFRVISQFSPSGDKTTLADFIKETDVYPAGRLDYDSEGLLLLTNNGALQHIIASPNFKQPKTYWVQVEGEISDEALKALSKGVMLKDGLTKPAIAQRIPEPDVWQRTPPVRQRQNIPTSWLSLQIKEGKNRQVRRMTAAVGFPTLRLIRYAIGPFSIDQLNHGEWCYASIPPSLEQEVSQFEQRKQTRTTPPHRRRSHSKKPPIPHGKRMARGKTGHQPAGGTRGKR
ncbi:pseudouridine synthase [Marinomonas epiphytica]